MRRADMREMLHCTDDDFAEVGELLISLGDELPAYKKEYSAAHSISSIRKKLVATSKLAAELAEFLADPLMRGTLHYRALKDARVKGTATPGLSDFFALEDAVKNIQRLLDSEVSTMSVGGPGDNKKLGVLPPKRWVIVLCADVFKRYRTEEATARNNDFLNFVNAAWFVVSGLEEDLLEAVKLAMPEVRQWVAAMEAARSNTG